MTNQGPKCWKGLNPPDLLVARSKRHASVNRHEDAVAESRPTGALAAGLDPRFVVAITYAVNIVPQLTGRDCFEPEISKSDELPRYWPTSSRSCSKASIARIQPNERIQARRPRSTHALFGFDAESESCDRQCGELVYEVRPAALGLTIEAQLDSRRLEFLPQYLHFELCQVGADAAVRAATERKRVLL